VAFCAAMLIHTPDPTYTGSEPTRANFRLAVKIALHIVALIWLIELLNSGLDLGLERFGVRPRQLVGLPGILLAPLLHAGLIRRDRRAIAATLLVCFMYGALAWGVLPIEPGVSWETHLAAALIGVLLVITLRHLDIPPRTRYLWEAKGTNTRTGHPATAIPDKEVESSIAAWPYLLL
jgi:Rhomboid family